MWLDLTYFRGLDFLSHYFGKDIALLKTEEIFKVSWLYDIWYYEDCFCTPKRLALYLLICLSHRHKLTLFTAIRIFLMIVTSVVWFGMMSTEIMVFDNVFWCWSLSKYSQIFVMFKNVKWFILIVDKAVRFHLIIKKQLVLYYNVHDWLKN